MGAIEYIEVEASSCPDVMGLNRRWNFWLQVLSITIEGGAVTVVDEMVPLPVVFEERRVREARF